MSDRSRGAGSLDELLDVLKDDAATEVRVTGAIAGASAIRLRPGQVLEGTGEGASLAFAPGADGVTLTRDNAVRGLALLADPDRCAIANDTTQSGFGSLDLRGLRVRGQVRLLAQDATQGGHLHVDGLDIEDADATAFGTRPSGFGVQVIPGAFTLWNRQPDTGSRITAALKGLSVGRPGRPARGSGVFIAGTPGGGSTVVTRLETGEIHTHGGIAPGTADRISGGVFIVSGAVADEVRNRGPVTTYGPNDMVLDNWGSVERWTAEAQVTSHGPSGIGFVNFGDLGELRVEAAIETFGAGARGFNVYDGTLRSAEFDRVVTRGDGAVGVQISRRVGRIVVRRGIETFGGRGASLVKGVVTELPAVPLSIKPGGSAREIRIGGGLRSHGEGIEAMELHGEIERLEIADGLGPTGTGFAPI